MILLTLKSSPNAKLTAQWRDGKWHATIALPRHSRRPKRTIDALLFALRRETGDEAIEAILTTGRAAK